MKSRILLFGILPALSAGYAPRARLRAPRRESDQLVQSRTGPRLSVMEPSSLTSITLTSSTTQDPTNNSKELDLIEFPTDGSPLAETTAGNYVLGFPLEKNSELSVDQKVLGEVLKEPSIEILSVCLVLLSSCLVALSTLNTIDLKSFALILRLENMIAFIFALEFFARWYAQFRWKGMIDYLLEPLVLVDLVVVILPLIPILVPTSAGLYNILPDWAFSSASLINLRLLRILRLQRVLEDMTTFSDFQAALGIETTEVKPYKLELARVVLSIFTLLSVSTGLVYSTEHNVNPDISTYFDALYFTLTTLTTVGFGDIVPVTAEGKLVVSGSILAGVAVIPAQAAALVEALLAREESKTESTPKQKKGASRKNPMAIDRKEMRTNVCPNCSAGRHWVEADFCWSCGSPLDD